MKIVYAPGVWDLMHGGHRRFLQASKELGDFLIVGVLSDEGAAAYKRRPAQSQEERRGNVADLRYVDLTVNQPGTDPTPVLDRLTLLGLCPSVLTHGDDWSRLREGMATLSQLGIELVLLPYGPGEGTTGILRRIREAV
jgi:cytidyltransferase-like protein